MVTGVPIAPIHHQWFITRTLRDFIVGQSANPNSDEYEISNALERWLITMANQANNNEWRSTNSDRIVPWAKVYHLLDVNDPFVIKFKNELSDKMTLAAGVNLDTLFEQIVQYVNSQLVNVALPEYTPEITTVDGVQMLRYGTDNVVVEVPITTRIQTMINQSDLNLVTADVIYYQTLLSRGNQWGLPQAHYDFLYDTEDVRIEAFASPFNSRLFGKVDAGFMSLYPDIEEIWGSVANFFNANLSQYEGNVVLNPPFIESIMEAAANKVVDYLSTLTDDNETTFFFVMPAWSRPGNETPAYTILNNSPYKKARLDLNKGTYNYEDVDGTTIPARFNSVYFALSKGRNDSDQLLTAMEAGTTKSVPVVEQPFTTSVAPTITMNITKPIAATSSMAVNNVDNVTTPSATVSATIDTITTTSSVEPPNWFNDLMTYLRQLLLNATSDPAIINNLLSEPTHKVWRRAFTHQSWDRNKVANYETLETLGDKVLDLTFIEYTLARFPDISESELTELRNKFVGKKELSQVSKNLGLPNHVLTKFPISIDTEEDLFESFFGALQTAADIVMGRGTGYALCKAMLSLIYDNWGITPELAQKSSVNRVKETFEKLAWTFDLNDIEESSKTKDGYIMMLKFPDLAFAAFEQMGRPLQIEYFARGDGRTQTEARDNAYDSGIQALEALGLTSEVVEASKTQEKLVGPLRELLRRVNSEDVRGVFKEITFAPKFESNTETAVQMVGLYNISGSTTDYQDILVTVIGRPLANEIELQRVALEKFLTNGKTNDPIYV